MYKDKFFKLLVLFLVIVIAISFSLVGCKTTSTDTTAAAETTAAAADTIAAVETTAAAETAANLDEYGLPILPEPEKEVTLDMWMQDWTAGIEITQDVNKMIKEKHPNININIIPQPMQDIGHKFIPSIMAGTEADMMWVLGEWKGNADPSELFLKLTPEIFPKEDLEKYIDRYAVIDSIGSDGELYGVGWGNEAESWGILVNKDLTDEAGINIDDLKTWDDVIAAAKKLTKYDSNGKVTRSGLSFTYLYGIQVWLDCILQAGGKPFDPETKKWDFNTPIAKEVTKWWTDMVLVDKVDDPLIGNAYDNFPKNLCAMFLIGPWALGAMRVDYPEMNVAWISPPPVYPGGQPVYDMPPTSNWVFSKRLENDPDKLKAAYIIAREYLVNPQSDIIRLGKWTGAIQNKKLIEMIKSGDVKIPGDYGDIAVKISTKIVPYIKDMGTKVDKSLMTETVYYPEIEKIWNGTQSVDEALENITKLVNEAQNAL